MTDRINDSPDEEMLERLMAEAGPRPALNAEHLATIREATRQAWQAETAQAQRLTGRSHRRTFLALAASLGAALLLTWWLVLRPDPIPVTVAKVERVTGKVIVDSAGGSEAAAVGRQLSAGSEVQTAAGSALIIRLEGGAEVRFDGGAQARLAAANEIELRRGSLYVDTGQIDTGAGHTSIEIRTSFGTARDIGTKFSVGVAGGVMTVRVREGVVEVEQGTMRRTASAGSEVVVSDRGVEQRAIAPWGEEWSWVMPLAEPFEIEGRSLRQLLDWSAAETGWTLRFEDPILEQKASTIILHGTIDGLPPDEAPFAVLAGAGLSGELEEGELVIREVQR